MTVLRVRADHAIEHFFRVYIASSKHEEGGGGLGEFETTTSWVCITFENPSFLFNTVGANFELLAALNQSITLFTKIFTNRQLRKV